MGYFFPDESKPITSEMIRQDCNPDGVEALRITRIDEQAASTDVAVSVCGCVASIVSACGIVALAGFTLAILVPVATLGVSALWAWNARITQRDREEEAIFLSEHPEILDLIQQKIDAGEDRDRIAAAYEVAISAYFHGQSEPLKCLGYSKSEALPSSPTAEAPARAPYPLDPDQQPSQPIGNDTRLGAIDVPASPPGQTQPTLNIDGQTGKQFDWSRLDREYNDFPHLFLLGKTGAGKSYVSDRLVRFLTGFAVVISPKKMPSDFVGLQVIGLPYQYRAIHRALVALEKLMVDREAEMQRTGNTDFIPINVILDELPVSSSGCKDLDLDLLKPLKALIRAGRTSKIRLIILAQGSEVKALGIEGEGGLRDSLTYVYLKGFVEDHAAKNKIDISQVDRPCIIEGQIADTSFLSNYESIAKQGLNLTGAIPQFSESEAKKLERAFNLPAADHKATGDVEEDAIESVSALDGIRSAFPGWKPKSQDVAAKIVDWMAGRADKTFLPGEVRKSIRLLKDDEALTIDRVKKLLDLLTEKQFLSSDESGRYAIAQFSQQTDDYDF
jgi:hypothetical protein